MVRPENFVRDSRGAISILFGLSLLILLGAAGLSFDATNLFKARAALQAAADGAALAVSADSVTSSSQVGTLARNYLSRNAPPAALVQINRISAYYDANTKTVSVTVAGSAPTSFMSLVGVQTAEVSASSKAKRGDTGPLDLVLALDVTDSMSAKLGSVTKIATLKTAAANLANSLMTSPNARIGIVPFANYVTVDPALRGANWLEAPADTSTPWCAWSGGSGSSCQWETYDCSTDGVVRVCRRPINCVNSGSITPEWVCGVTEVKWNGCMLSRMAGGGYVTTLSSPAAPSYYGQGAGTPAKPPAGADQYGCSVRMSDLTSVKSAVIQAITQLTPYGETYIPDGLIWSWNMLTKEAPLTSARSLEEMESLGGKRALVLMTDGYNTRYAGEGGWHFPIGSDTVNQAKADVATSQICARIKADGIIVYTVAFGVTDSAIKAILQDCASAPSKFFDAADTAALNTSFGKIGAELQRVRLMQ